MLMGMTYSAQNDYKDARDAYEKLLVLAPNNAVALNNLAYIYAENLGDLDKGYQLAQQGPRPGTGGSSRRGHAGMDSVSEGTVCLRLEPAAGKRGPIICAVPDVQFHLGMTCYMMGDEANARTALQRALQLKQGLPETNECNQCLAVLAIDTKTAGADPRAWLEKRVASQPNDSIALHAARGHLSARRDGGQGPRHLRGGLAGQPAKCHGHGEPGPAVCSPRPAKSL